MTMLTDFIPVGAPIVTPPGQPGTGTTSCWIIKYLNTDTMALTKIFDTDREIIYCVAVTRVCSTRCQPLNFECLASYYSYSEEIFVCSRLSIDLDQSQIAQRFTPYLAGTWSVWISTIHCPTTLFWQNRPLNQSRHSSRETRAPMCCNSSMFSPNE